MAGEPPHPDSARKRAQSDLSPPGSVEGAVGEGIEVEVGAQLAVDAGEDVEVEARGDAGGIVIGRMQHAFVLDQVDPDDEPRGGSENARGAAQESVRLVRLEIADG